MATQTSNSSSNDSSTIHTVDELITQEAIATSSALLEDVSTSISASSWETATDTPASSSSSPQSTQDEMTITNRLSATCLVGDEQRKGREGAWRGGAWRGGAWRGAGGGESSTDTGGSHYTSDWESSQLSDDCQDGSIPTEASVSQRRFVREKLRLLKRSGHMAEITTTQDPEAPHPEPEERKLFCQKVIQRVRCRPTDRQGGAGTKTDGIGKKSGSSIHDSGVLINQDVVDRLKIENLLSTMKRVTSVATTHGTDLCQHCQESQSAVLRRDFIRHRTSRLGNELTERRLDWLLNTQDPLTAVGDLVSELPKPTDDPQEIWDRLIDHGMT